jgi:hypothetical protein
VRVELSYPVKMTLVCGKPKLEGVRALTEPTPLAKVRFDELGSTCPVADTTGYLILLAADAKAGRLISLHLVFASAAASASLRKGSFASPVETAKLPASFKTTCIAALPNRQFVLSSPTTGAVAIGAVTTLQQCTVTHGRSRRTLPSKYHLNITCVVSNKPQMQQPLSLAAFTRSQVFVTDVSQNAVLEVDFDQQTVTRTKADIKCDSSGAVLLTVMFAERLSESHGTATRKSWCPA